MATHSSILAWRIPCTEEPGRLESMGLKRVRHDFSTKPKPHTEHKHGQRPLTTDMPLLGWSCSSPQSAKTQIQCQLHGLITVLLYYFRNQEIPGNLFYVDTSKLLLELFLFLFLSFFFQVKKKIYSPPMQILHHIP